MLEHFLYACRNNLPYRDPNPGYTNQRPRANCSGQQGNCSPGTSRAPFSPRRNQPSANADLFGDSLPCNTRGIRVQVADQSADTPPPEEPDEQDPTPGSTNPPEQRTTTMALLETPSSFSADSEDYLISMAKGDIHPAEMANMLSQKAHNSPSADATLVSPGTPVDKSTQLQDTSPNSEVQVKTNWLPSSLKKTLKYSNSDKKATSNAEQTVLQGESFYTPMSTPDRNQSNLETTYDEFALNPFQSDSLDSMDDPKQWHQVKSRQSKSRRHAGYHSLKETIQASTLYMPPNLLKILILVLAFAITFLIPSGDSKLRTISFPSFKTSSSEIPSPPSNPHCFTRPTYVVTTRQRKQSRGSMVDRGANGGIAGNDTRFLTKSDRRIDITGINNHQMTDLRIGTAAGKVITQRGPAIVLMHEYALWGHGPSIHSSIQLEHAKIKVDDRSMHLGGTQSLTSPCGHTIPLDIIDGLPYMKMTVPTDTELEQYPHITLTIDKKWDSHVYDKHLSNDLDWHNTVQKIRIGEQHIPFDMDGKYKHIEPHDYPR